VSALRKCYKNVSFGKEPILAGRWLATRFQAINTQNARSRPARSGTGVLLALVTASRLRYTRRVRSRSETACRKGDSRGVSSCRRPYSWRVQRNARIAADSEAGSAPVGARADGVRRGARSPRGRVVPSVVGGGCGPKGSLSGPNGPTKTSERLGQPHEVVLALGGTCHSRDS
jgi:hypothetical protein